jgi:hypothetical protein
MSDSKPSTVRDVADLAKAAISAIPVYSDAVSPAAKEVGRSLELVAKSIRVALAPLAAIVWGYEHIADYLDRALSERLKGVPPDRIQSPSVSIAGPAIEAMKFTGDAPDLRACFARLLATAMDRETASIAHPAFVETIRQMCADEARMIAWMSTSPHGPFPLANLMMELTPPLRAGGEYLTVHRNVSIIPKAAGCAAPDLGATYLDNLERLGLIRVERGRSGDVAAINALHESDAVASFLNDSRPGFRHYVVDLDARFTDFGKQFLRACIGG